MALPKYGSNTLPWWGEDILARVAWHHDKNENIL